MITRREFMKAFGVLTGAAVVGSIAKPTETAGEAIAMEGTDKIGIGMSLSPPTPVHIADVAFNARYACYPTAPLATSCGWVDEYGQIRKFHGAGFTPGKTWPA